MVLINPTGHWMSYWIIDPILEHLLLTGPRQEETQIVRKGGRPIITKGVKEGLLDCAGGHKPPPLYVGIST